jgi:hypothetical protein
MPYQTVRRRPSSCESIRTITEFFDVLRDLVLFRVTATRNYCRVWPALIRTKTNMARSRRFPRGTVSALKTPTARSQL